mmetsp:Transcript_14059/g.31853  ORF Transcript_14059/g.31853 Transcript_14059/m.31853 type:complete len:330 (-) Transcript_14059:82-1071(-)
MIVRQEKEGSTLRSATAAIMDDKVAVWPPDHDCLLRPNTHKISHFQDLLVIIWHKHTQLSHQALDTCHFVTSNQGLVSSHVDTVLLAIWPDVHSFRHEGGRTTDDALRASLAVNHPQVLVKLQFDLSYCLHNLIVRPWHNESWPSYDAADARQAVLYSSEVCHLNCAFFCQCFDLIVGSRDKDALLFTIDHIAATIDHVAQAYVVAHLQDSFLLHMDEFLVRSNEHEVWPFLHAPGSSTKVLDQSIVVLLQESCLAVLLFLARIHKSLPWPLLCPPTIWALHHNLLARIQLHNGTQYHNQANQQGQASASTTAACTCHLTIRSLRHEVG